MGPGKVSWVNILRLLHRFWMHFALITFNSSAIYLLKFDFPHYDHDDAYLMGLVAVLFGAPFMIYSSFCDVYWDLFSKRDIVVSLVISTSVFTASLIAGLLLKLEDGFEFLFFFFGAVQLLNSLIVLIALRLRKVFFLIDLIIAVCGFLYILMFAFVLLRMF